MMGNYPHAKVRPKFGVLMQIKYDWMFPPDAKDFMAWMMRNDNILRYCTKEWYAFLVMHVPVVRGIFYKRNRWDEFEYTVSDAMDTIRATINARGKVTMDAFDGLDKVLKRSHEVSLLHATKLKKGAFAEIMRDNLNKFYDVNILDQKSTWDVPPDDGRLTAQQMELLELVAEKFNRRFNETGEKAIVLDWLLPAGISERGYKLVRTAYYLYEREDVPDHRLSRFARELYVISKIDFAILRTLLNKFVMLTKTRTLKLSANTALAQIEAKRHTLRIAPWQTLPPDAFSYWECPSCLRTSSYVIQPIIKDGAEIRIHDLGHEKSFYNPTDGHLYCARQTATQAHKDLNIRKLADDPTHKFDDNLERAKMIRKYHSTPDCINSRLVEIDYLGKIRFLDGKPFALCTVCCGLIAYQTSKYGKLGLTCTHHTGIPIVPPPAIPESKPVRALTSAEIRSRNILSLGAEGGGGAQSAANPDNSSSSNSTFDELISRLRRTNIGCHAPLITPPAHSFSARFSAAESLIEDYRENMQMTASVNGINNNSTSAVNVNNTPASRENMMDESDLTRFLSDFSDSITTTTPNVTNDVGGAKGNDEDDERESKNGVIATENTSSEGCIPSNSVFTKKLTKVHVCAYCQRPLKIPLKANKKHTGTMSAFCVRLYDDFSDAVIEGREDGVKNVWLCSFDYYRCRYQFRNNHTPMASLIFKIIAKSRLAAAAHKGAQRNLPAAKGRR
jgi:hypothetical protein